MTEYNLNSVKEWHNQIVTHAFINGVFIPDWYDYERNHTMGIRWSKAYVGAVTHDKRNLMSKIVNTFFLKDFVIAPTLGLSDLIITAETDGYQVLYNLLVQFHPNLSNKHKVQRFVARLKAMFSHFIFKG